MTGMKLKEMKNWLRKQPLNTLVEIITEQVKHNAEFCNLLDLRIAADKAEPDIQEIRRTLRNAMIIDDFIDWRESFDYSSGVEQVIAQLTKMLKAHPKEVLALTEEALDLWEATMQCIDDDGCMDTIRSDLLELHLKACKLVKPDHTKLAEMLFVKYISSDWDIFCDACETYGALLGKEGKAHYRTLVEEEWQKLPRVMPGEKSDGRYGRDRRIEELMLDCAEEDSDFEKIIEIMSRDLSESHDYLQIAERCRNAKKYELAQQWAEKGVAAFKERPDIRLHDFLAEEYLRAKRPDDAMSVMWKSFEDRPDLPGYKSLAGYAMRIKAWPEWRKKALQHLREDVSQRKRNHVRKGYGWRPTPDSSLLVEIFLWEKDVESAWQEAKKGGCHENLWLQLAKIRETTHPEDAISIYRRQIEPLLNRKNNQSYEAAVKYLGEINKLMTSMGKTSEFKQDLHDIKIEWKRLRNFIKYVERTKWGKSF